MSRTFSSSQTKILYPLNNNSLFPLPPPPNPQLLGTTVLFVSLDLPIMSFHIWLISLSMLSRSFQAVACGRISFLFWPNGVMVFHYMDIPRFVNSFLCQWAVPISFEYCSRDRVVINKNSCYCSTYFWRKDRQQTSE